MIMGMQYYYVYVHIVSHMFPFLITPLWQVISDFQWITACVLVFADDYVL